MVYDPIRDCDIPSPAVSNHPDTPWRGTPGSVGASGGYGGGSQGGYFDRRHGTHSPSEDAYGSAGGGGAHRNGLFAGGQPPNFSLGQQSPTKASRPAARTSTSYETMSLRQLMHDDGEDARRSSGQAAPVDHDDRRSSTQSQSLNRLLNDDSRSRSSVSSMPSQSPRNSMANLLNGPTPQQSPGSAPYEQPAAHLAIAGSRHSHSRSPQPPSQPYPTDSYVSPGGSASSLPPDYPSMTEPIRTPVSASLEHQHSGSSSSKRQGSVARPMLPPDTIPRHNSNEDAGPSSATRLTPQSATMPLRSPSISLSPRSGPQPLPIGAGPGSAAAYSLARPTSSGRPYSYDSPSVQHRRLSEDQSRPSSSGELSARPTSRSGSGHGQQLYVPRRDSHTSVASSSHREPLRSSSPQKRPYDPERITDASTVYDPIQADEVEHLKVVGKRNNPLYEWSQRKKKARAPSWSAGALSSGRPGRASTSATPQPQPQPLPQPQTQAQAPARPAAAEPSRARLPAKPQYDGDHRDDSYEQHLNGSAHAGNDYTNDLSQSQRGHKRAKEEEEQAVQRRRTNEAQHFVGNAAVASYYNSRQEVGVQARDNSPIIGLKKFNNWIKSVLIGKFTKKPQGGPGANVLDIGCGKGGDLNKWKQARIALYVGLDIADQSVDQARTRWQTMPPNKKFDAHFFAHDCYSQALSDVLPPQLQTPIYDNVTMQFCMHYAFENANKARMMMENVSRYLRVGGFFIGTIPDAEFLLQKLSEIPDDGRELKFGNPCYFVEFEEREHQGIYGHKYRFFLTDAVEDVPEYVVEWDNFQSLAEEYGLELVYKEPFANILAQEQESRDFGGLLTKMGVLNHQGESAMDADQWEAANIYMGFAFQKVR